MEILKDIMDELMCTTNNFKKTVHYSLLVFNTLNKVERIETLHHVKIAFNVDFYCQKVLEAV